MQLKGPTTAGLMYSGTGGTGPVVVLLHGVLMNGTVWTQVVDALRDRYRCIVPELPFGAHARPMPDDANLTLESIARMNADSDRPAGSADAPPSLVPDIQYRLMIRVPPVRMTFPEPAHPKSLQKNVSL